MRKQAREVVTGAALFDPIVSWVGASFWYPSLFLLLAFFALFGVLQIIERDAGDVQRRLPARRLRPVPVRGQRRLHRNAGAGRRPRRSARPREAVLPVGRPRGVLLRQQPAAFEFGDALLRLVAHHLCADASALPPLRVLARPPPSCWDTAGLAPRGG